MGDMPDISSILNMLNSSSANKSTVPNNDSGSSKDGPSIEMPDMETMMRIMKIMNSLKTDTTNPSTNLLISLKPFLRESKKEKVDQYINILKVTDVISKFNDVEGDKK